MGTQGSYDKKEAARVKRLIKEHQGKRGVRIDLGCGDRKTPGFIGVDFRKTPMTDIVQDLESFPWKYIPDEIADVVMAAHVVEHINPAQGIFMRFMDEVWRITKVGGQFLASMPYAGSPGYWQDPTHVNGCTEITWTYFDPLAKDPRTGQLTHLYTLYRPKPWKIVNVSFQLEGGMEVLLEKRPIDHSYKTADDFNNPAPKIFS